MSTFVMLGKYSPQAIKEASAERTKKSVEIIESLGGKVNTMYALLGEYDLVFIADFPGIKEAMKSSIDLNKLTGVSFSTYPAVTVEDFDETIIVKP